MVKSIVIIGSNGQLGKALQAQFPMARAIDRTVLDITSKYSVEKFDWSNIDVIINAAAYTNVDGAETEQGRRDAWDGNATAVAHLSRICQQNNITLVHISSDYVFDGTQEIHNESESFSPLGVYGQSKAAGDIVASLTLRHYIIRTSWVIGEGNNFVRTMKSLAEKGIKPSVVSDQIGRLSFTTDIAAGVAHLLRLLPHEAPYGTYNLTNDGKPVSWADIARDVYELSGFEPNDVNDVTTAEYYVGKDGIAPRPLQSTLSLDKIKETGFAPKKWREALTEYLS